MANLSSGKVKALQNNDKTAIKVDSLQKKSKEESQKGIKIPFFSKAEDNDNMTMSVGVATQSAAVKSEPQQSSASQVQSTAEEYEAAPSYEELRTLKNAMSLETEAAVAQ